MGGDVAVLIPVKAFHRAKARLSGTLDPPTRETLARHMAETVVRAASPLPVAVVCDDETVSEWAGAQGATVLWRPGHGLNGAVRSGVDGLAAAGYRRVVVAHSDLPLAVDLQWVARFDGVTLVPDRRDDGTNVLSVPTDAIFEFGYGGGSFRHHAREALGRRMALRVVREPLLGWDVDTADDLAPFPDLVAATCT
ncbi:MAG: 2-phospho-L-lactate guanylyltransferase [Actinomycetota bacterium]|nr:2-phospho-L-lactate guanylyltransferase [Actinomycetota bacterium]